MIKIFRLRTKITLDESDLRRVLWGLRTDGWIPASLSAEAHFAELAGVAESAIRTKSLRRPQANPMLTGDARGDFFFRDGSILYVLVRGEAGYLVQMTASAQLPAQDPPGIEVGLVTASQTSEPELSRFAEALEAVVRRDLDGRKTRHLVFDWQKPAPRNATIDTIRKRLAQADTTTRFRDASELEKLLPGALVLRNEAARTLLREIAGSKFARKQDLLARRVDANSFAEQLQTLSVAGLATDASLLQCRSANVPLLRVESGTELQRAEIANLTCGSCGRSFSDELLVPGYAVSDLGRRLNDGSHWMTVWVTSRLVALGIEPESILWNVEEESEEVDIIAEVLGELWLFELKDRDFQPGDAYPLSYRSARYRSNRTVIVSTAKVADAAKRVFDEVVGPSRRGEGPRGDRLPVYIEGLDAFDTQVSQAMAKVSMEYAQIVLGSLSASLGWDVSGLLGDAVAGPSALERIGG